MDINKITAFMVEEQITSRQFLLLWCLFNDPLYKHYVKERGKTKKLLVYGDSNSLAALRLADNITMEDINVLKEKELIIDLNQGKTFYFDQLFLTQKFCDKFFISRDAFEELWEEYPTTILIQDKVIPARSGDYDVLKEKYLSTIGKDKSLHESILRTLVKAKELGIISIGIEKFILSRHWDTFNDMMGRDEEEEKKIL